MLNVYLKEIVCVSMSCVDDVLNVNGFGGVIFKKNWLFKTKNIYNG